MSAWVHGREHKDVASYVLQQMRILYSYTRAKGQV